jgi:multiple sugar transport system permease protein
MWNKLKVIVKKNIGGWAIMLPTLVLFTFFVWAPLIENIAYSFYDVHRFQRQEFIWFENYQRVFSDPAFASAFKNTFVYAFWSLVIGFLVPLFLGLVLSEVIHFKAGFRCLLYLPSIISGVAVMLMWTQILDGSRGSMINGILSIFGAEPITVLSNSQWVIPMIVLVMTWRGAGATVLVYLSSLQSVDTTLYEAARIDGSNLFQRIIHVTLPTIRPTIKLLLILQIISVFQVFYEPMMMTAGGPDNASISLMYLCYRYTFIDHEAGMGAACGVILAIIIVSLSVLYFKLSKKEDDV